VQLRYATLFTLTLLSVLAAAAVVVRMELSRRGERFVAWAMLWNGMIIAPIYVLGFTSLLYRAVLAGVSLVFLLAVIAACRIGTTSIELRNEIIELVLELISLPRDAIRECLRKGNLLVAGAVFFAIALSIWTAIQSWYVSSWGQWDALWYHEPMIGWAIQNHGFDVVPLPMSAQKTNGYPRLVEMTQLWWVIFTDRRLIEIMNSVFSPVLAVATYMLCRRYTRDKVAAMGFGVCILCSPVVSNLMQTTYVDTQYAAFVVAATYFATRMPLRMRDALLTSLCLTLAIGSKSMALVSVPVIGLVALWRLGLAHGRTRRRDLAIVVATGVVLIGLMFSATYVKNYLAFKNPLWPDVKVDVDRFGIHWPGAVPLFGPGEKLNQGFGVPPLPFESLVTDLYAIPYSKSGSYYYQLFDYGFYFAYVLVPLSAFAIVFAFAYLLHARLWPLWMRIRGRPAPEPPRRDSLVATRDMLMIAFVGVVMWWTSPALWGARYNIAAMSIMMVVCAWLGGRRRFTRLGHGTATFAAVGSVIMCSWTVPRWYWYPHELVKLARVSYPEREFTAAARFAPGLHLTRGSSVTKDVGMARERELGPGHIILFNDNYGNYPAHFWNNTYSNKAIWVPSTTNMLEEAERLHATWIFLANGDPLAPSLRAAGSGWLEIGTMNIENWGTVFRRVR
jgi:hypothetical protein